MTAVVAPVRSVPRRARPALGLRRVVVVDDRPVHRAALIAAASAAGHVACSAQDDERSPFRYDASDIALVHVVDTSDAASDAIPRLRRLGVPTVVLTAVDDPDALATLVERGAWAVVHAHEPAGRLTAALAVAGSDDVGWAARRSDLLAHGERVRVARREAMAPFLRLTSRERTVLHGLTLGKTAEQLAAEHAISLATVRSHIRAVLETLGVRSQVAAVAMALRSGWAT